MRISQQQSASLEGQWFLPWRFGCLLGMLFVVSFPRVAGGWETFAYLDAGQFANPVAFYFRDCFWRGELPLWNPLNSCGIPFLAQWNTLTLYPLSLLYLLLPFPWALGIFGLLHLWIGGMGMYFLVHRWTGHRLGAAMAGTAFAFSGLSWYALMWPHIVAALAWMPWTVLLLERAWREGGRLILLAALVAGLQLLSGGAEVILLTWVAAGALWMAAVAGTKSLRREFIGRFIAVAAFAAGLAAVQLLPFLDLLAHSQRSAGFATRLGAMPLDGWLNLLVPLFHCLRNPQGVFVQPDQWTGSYYLGIGVVLLTIVAVWRQRGGRVWLLAGLALACLWLALGEQGGLYAAGRRLIPWLGLLRFPVKFVILTAFVAPLLAGMGVAWLLTLPESSWALEWKRVRLSGAVLAGLIGGILWLAWSYRPEAGYPGLTLLNGLGRILFLGLILILLSRVHRTEGTTKQALLQCGLVIVLWCDVFTHNGNLSPTVPCRVLQPNAVRQFFNWPTQPVAGQERLMQSRAVFQQMMKIGYSNLEMDSTGRRLTQFFDYNLLDRVPKFDGFYSLDLREYAELFHRLYWTTNTAPGLESFAGVSLVNNPVNPVNWLRRTGFQPLVTAGRQPRFAGDAETLQALFSGEFDPERSVYLPTDIRSAVHATGQGRARVESNSFGSDNLAFVVDADAPAVVTVAQSFYHPWHAYVDGQRVSLWRANYAFQALEVPSGRHQVQLRYEDYGFRVGAVLSALTVLAGAGAWLSMGRKETRTSPATAI